MLVVHLSIVILGYIASMHLFLSGVVDSFEGNGWRDRLEVRRYGNVLVRQLQIDGSVGVVPINLCHGAVEVLLRIRCNLPQHDY